MLTVSLFFARGIIAGVFQAVYVYTPEVIAKSFLTLTHKHLDNQPTKLQ